MFSRRRAISGAFLSALSIACGQAWAQDTSAPLRIVIAGPPGGGVDTMARLISEKFQAKVGRPVIIDSRPGGGTVIASNFVRSQPPDGLTLYLTPNSYASAAAIEPEIHRFDPSKDFSPIARITLNSSVFVARADLPAKNMGEFIAYTRANPGKVKIATFGQASTSHLMAVWLAKEAKLDMIIVHYKGSAQANQDLMGGFVDVKFDALIAMRAPIATGRVKVLASADEKSSPLTQNVPTVSETVPGVVSESFFVVLGPPKMAPELVAKLSGYFTEIIESPDLAERLNTQLGCVAAPLGPAETGQMIGEYFTRMKHKAHEYDVKATS